MLGRRALLIPFLFLFLSAATAQDDASDTNTTTTTTSSPINVTTTSPAPGNETGGDAAAAELKVDAQGDDLGEEKFGGPLDEVVIPETTLIFEETTVESVTETAFPEDENTTDTPFPESTTELATELTTELATEETEETEATTESVTDFTGSSICTMEDWSMWTACPVTCGGGFRYRYRQRSPPGCPDPPPALEPANTEECEPCCVFPCPISCTLSEWSSWCPCSSTCGQGVRSRRRVIVTPALFGAPPCPLDQLVQTESCVVNEVWNPTPGISADGKRCADDPAPEAPTVHCRAVSVS